MQNLLDLFWQYQSIRILNQNSSTKYKHVENNIPKFFQLAFKSHFCKCKTFQRGNIFQMWSLGFSHNFLPSEQEVTHLKFLCHFTKRMQSFQKDEFIRIRNIPLVCFCLRLLPHTNLACIRIVSLIPEVVKKLWSPLPIWCNSLNNNHFS